MTTTPPEPRLFAMYCDITRYRPSHADVTVPDVSDPNAWEQRWQWIILPQQVRTGGNASYPMFWRHQTSHSHRATWKSMYRGVDLTHLIGQEIKERAGQHVLNVLRDPFVVEMTPQEYKHYTDAGLKTPWKIIERVHRATRRRPGYTV